MLRFSSEIQFELMCAFYSSEPLTMSFSVSDKFSVRLHRDYSTQHTVTQSMVSMCLSDNRLHPMHSNTFTFLWCLFVQLVLKIAYNRHNKCMHFIQPSDEINPLSVWIFIIQSEIWKWRIFIWLKQTVWCATTHTRHSCQNKLVL